MTEPQPKVAVCHCGAAEHTTAGGSGLSFPPGWETPASVVPGISSRHAHMLVCGLCPEHANDLEGWGGKPFPDDDAIDWPEELKV
jgi:hypothetical protein